MHPLTALWERIRDLDGLETSPATAGAWASAARSCCTPRTCRWSIGSTPPTPEDVDFYRGLLKAYEEAEAAGLGAVMYGDIHIDKAHADKATEWLARVDTLAESARRHLSPTVAREDPSCAACTSRSSSTVLEVKHSFTRTVTEMDNVLFTSLTMNVAPIHLDEEYSRENLPQGQRLFNSLYIAALVGGMIVPELTYQTTIGNLGYEKMTFPAPVFHGDTIRAESTILKKRESKSRTDAGIVWFEHRGYNQRDELIHLCHRTGMISRNRPRTADDAAHVDRGLRSRTDYGAWATAPSAASVSKVDSSRPIHSARTARLCCPIVGTPSYVGPS